MTQIAAATEGTTTAPGGGSSMIILLVAFVAIFYFIAIRPQSRQMKEKQAMLSNMRPDDAIVTIGGINGVVVKADEDEDTIIVRVAPGVEMEFLKAAVQSIKNRDWREEFPQFQKKGLFAPKDGR
ncbi:MAG: preprotein translocase subunit YajC [Gracilibacteraceae bacterium]|jgi:preprotein translocase subunit YajC|nr:preprotein translocase subunit YajC [Gracilibacteraceae bacterium]